MKDEKTDDNGVIRTPTIPADGKLGKRSLLVKYICESATMIVVLMIVLGAIQGTSGSGLAMVTAWIIAFLFRILCTWFYRAIKRPSADELVPHWAKQEGGAE